MQGQARDKRRAGLVVLAMAAGVVGGCMVGPNYKTPALRMDQDFGRFAAELSAATGPGAATQTAARRAAPTALPVAWWEQFNDALLSALVGRATAGNLDLRQSAARLRASRAQRQVTAGGQLPEVNADTGYTHQRFSQNAAPFNAFNVPGFPWEFNLYQLGFDATWEVDVFGGTRRAVEAATADVGAGIEDRRAIFVTVAAEVARNYVELRGYQLELQLARQNLSVQRETLALTQEQMNKGVGTQLDVSRAQSQVSATEGAIPLLEQGEYQAIDRLSVLVNEPVEGLAVLQEARPVPGIPEAVAVGVPAELLRRRPDIRKAERVLAGSTARVGQAVAALYPRFSLTGFFNLQSASIEDLFEWKSRAFSIGPTVQWPIFDAGELRAAVRVKTAQQEEALAAYEGTVRQAVAEVRDGLVAFKTQQQRRDALATAVDADLTTLDLSRQLYRQGMTDFLTVLDAERELFAAQDALAKTQAAQATALIGLYKALGGGWESAEAWGATGIHHGDTEARRHGDRGRRRDDGKKPQMDTNGHK